eukprot:TRINITY_DN7106_c0_g1_i1.p1 TRINITY_DN7106_c0_g1~~TRINITY_DN7106_c0_g1_i1.p1  ORF type:complete len:127 (+),score=0.68 TRINITY_DN7106_c0_g1_i1:578-958(+)
MRSPGPGRSFSFFSSPIAPFRLALPTQTLSISAFPFLSSCLASSRGPRGMQEEGTQIPALSSISRPYCFFCGIVFVFRRSPPCTPSTPKGSKRKEHNPPEKQQARRPRARAGLRPRQGWQPGTASA